MLKSAYTITQKAKAVAAVIGAVTTALVGYVSEDAEVAGYNVRWVLTGLAAVATYVATFKIPNADPPGTPPTPTEFEGTH